MGDETRRDEDRERPRNDDESHGGKYPNSRDEGVAAEEFVDDTEPPNDVDSEPPPR